MHRSAVLAARVVALSAFGLLATAGIPTNGIPTNGIPTNGIPTNGIPTNGIPTNGIPTNGANLDALLGSLVFGNQTVHEALIGRAFTQQNLTDPLSPVFQVWSDPYSILLLSYLWQDAHAFGDDLTFVTPNGDTVRFYGNVGVCDRGGTGWARNTPLDNSCARWLSALFVTQINQAGVHNLFSARGPSNASIGKQLTSMAPALASFGFHFATHTPVAAVTDACPDGTSGAANCGWQAGYVGTGTPGMLVKVTLTNTAPTLVQVDQGIMAHDACAAGCDVDVLASSFTGVTSPSVQFRVPASGVFNVQWTTLARADLAAKPRMTAQALSSGTVRFPSNELDVFPNREMTASANIFGAENIAPAVWACQTRLTYLYTVEAAPVVSLCDPSNLESCTPCTRSFTPGARTVIFPNAHLWLSRSWTSAQDYYGARACSSDLSTCIAAFEGYIDQRWTNPVTGRSVAPCASRSTDVDSATPLSYPGSPRKLNDADGCFVGTSSQTGFSVTTFFPNYRSIGACAAVGPQASATCSYAPQEPDRDPN